MEYRTSGALDPDRSVLVIGINGVVLGVDRASGTPRWRTDLASEGGSVFLAVGYGVVIASSLGATLYCLDFLTGVVRWRRPTRSRGRASILIEPDHIICAKGSIVECVGPRGESMWELEVREGGFQRTALGYPGNVTQADDS